MNDTTFQFGWQEIGSIKSFTNPAKRYHIVMNAKGHMGCTCPAWKHTPYANPDGSIPPCKHIKGLLTESLDSEGFDATLFGLTWLAHRIAAHL